MAFQHGIPSICLTKLFTFSRLISNGIGASRNGNWCLFKIVLFNIVFFNVASTKSSNIAGILSFGGLLGLIRKRLVEFRLDFLAGFLQVSLAGFLQVWLTFLPSSCLCSRCVSLGPTAISYASCMGFLLYRLGFVSRAAPCTVYRFMK